MTVLITILFLNLLVAGLAMQEDRLTAASRVGWPLGLVRQRQW
jgi:hypothetical protein